MTAPSVKSAIKNVSTKNRWSKLLNEECQLVRSGHRERDYEGNNRICCKAG
jgi:hypothetical protein